jgi:hypothetical protein
MFESNGILGAVQPLKPQRTPEVRDVREVFVAPRRKAGWWMLRIRSG